MNSQSHCCFILHHIIYMYARHPIHLLLFHHISSLSDISYRNIILFHHHIAIIFCTCHGGTAILSWAIFCSNLNVRIGMKVKSNFHQIRIVMGNIISETVSRLVGARKLNALQLVCPHACGFDSPFLYLQFLDEFYCKHKSSVMLPCLCRMGRLLFVWERRKELHNMILR